MFQKENFSSKSSTKGITMSNYLFKVEITVFTLIKWFTKHPAALICLLIIPGQHAEKRRQLVLRESRLHWKWKNHFHQYLNNEQYNPRNFSPFNYHSVQISIVFQLLLLHFTRQAFDASRLNEIWTECIRIHLQSFYVKRCQLITQLDKMVGPRGQILGVLMIINDTREAAIKRETHSYTCEHHIPLPLATSLD